MPVWRSSALELLRHLTNKTHNSMRRFKDDQRSRRATTGLAATVSGVPDVVQGPCWPPLELSKADGVDMACMFCRSAHMDLLET